jgi:diguanylate cyclase (GGDEF)-like protein
MPPLRRAAHPIRHPIDSMRSLAAALQAAAVLLVVGAALVLVEESTLALITDRYALVVYGVAAVLAAIFHRSRVAIAAMGLAYVELLREGALDVTALQTYAVAWIALLGILGLLRDRGVRSRMGLVQITLSLGALALAQWILEDPAAVDMLAAIRVLPEAANPLALPDVTLIVVAVSLLLGALAVARWRGPVERALLWTQMLVLASAHPALAPGESSVMLMAAGLLLSLSVVEQSYSMAYRDELTKLPGRRALMRELSEMTPPFTVAMVDVDHFKKFNDTHGHDVGDQVLQLVAVHLAAAPGANAYRYGGEEFTLVFPRRDRDESLSGAEAARASVENAEFALRAWNRPRKRPAVGKRKDPGKRPRKLSVTVSIGLADSAAGDGSPEAVLKKADEALYRAKEDGRNCVST